MQIAILGAGFSGLATAWHLLNRSPNIQVTLFDPLPIGHGTSGMAAGLLHPYAGARAQLNPEGWEGWNSTKRLINIAEEALGRPVSMDSGLLRIAVTERQKKDFAKATKNYNFQWLEPGQCAEYVEGLLPHPGIFTPSAATVHCHDYLEGLWLGCHRKGAQLIQEKIESLSQLADYDHMVIAVGGGFGKFPELRGLPLELLKGQLLELTWPKERKVPIVPVTGQAYVIVNKTGENCVVGATYERNFVSLAPDFDEASRQLLPKIAEMFRAWGPLEITGCRSGTRVSTPNHLPIAKRLTDQYSVITGMGSKGLLYHSLWAEKLTNELLDLLHN